MAGDVVAHLKVVLEGSDTNGEPTTSSDHQQLLTEHRDSIIHRDTWK